jgi:single-strand DNA-binding protein
MALRGLWHLDEDGLTMLKAQIIGNIGSDPELRYSAGGSPFLRFSVASNGRTRNAAGEWQDSTEWVRVTVFGQRAEVLAEHLQRGARVYVDGRLETRPWIDRSNEPRAGIELAANDIEFVGRRQDDSDQPAPARGERRTPVGAGARGAAAYATGTDERDLEDLPF